MQTAIRQTIALAIAASLAGISATYAADTGSHSGSQAQASTQGATSAPSASSALMSLRAEELEDMDVKTQAGEEIGKVEGLARSRESGEIYALIETGGIFDIGDTDVVLQLNRLQLQGDDLIVSGIGSQEELESQQRYDESLFQEIDDDDERTLAELSAAGAMGGALAQQTQFDDLDADHNGYLSESEAGQDPDLKSRWTEIDANKDRRIERSEFSAFQDKDDGSVPQSSPQQY